MRRKPATPFSIPVRYLRGIFAGLDHRQLDVEPFLKVAGIDHEALRDPKARLNLKQFSRLYMAVAVKLDDETLGLGMTPLRRGGAEIICRAACTGSNLLECAKIVAMAQGALWHDMIIRVATIDDGIQIVWQLRNPAPDYPALLHETIVLTTLGILTWLGGERVPVVHMDLPFRAPRHQNTLHELYADQIRFDQAETRLCFSAELANMPLRRQPSDIPSFIRLAPLSFIESILARGLISLRVRELLRDALPEVPTIDQVAATLALSPRTLHRKLEQEGESFQSIKDDLRCDLATQALTRTQTPLKQIASDLGFSDQATFQRAFAGWTGKSPGAYRQDHQSR